MKLFYKTLLIISCFLLIFNCAFGQAPIIEWQHSYGGTGDDKANAIEQTSDGGYIVAGFSTSINGDVTNNHGTNSDYWIIKLNANGAIEWQKSLGGSFHEVATDIHQTLDGGYIVSGGSNTSNNGDVTGHHGINNHDYWVVKLDYLGNIEWQKCLGGSDYDFARSIQQTLDGGYIVAGNASSTNGDVTNNHGGSNFGDYWVVKLDSIGNIEWQKALGGTGDDIANSVKQTTDGGYIVAGESASSDGDVTGHHGNPLANEYWVVKLDTDGNIEWEKALGGTSTDKATDILQTTDGNYIVAGFANSTNGDVTIHFGSYDYWLVKLDATGTLLWQKSFGGSFDDVPYSIQQTTDEGFIVSGYSSSHDNDLTNSNGGYDYWLIKLDSNVNIQWQKSLGGYLNGMYGDRSTSIDQTTDGQYIVAGFTNSTNCDVTGNHGYFDFWLVKLNDSFNTITGKQFFDQNNNSIQDNNESSIPNKKVTEPTTGRVAFPQPNGFYELSVLDTGNFAGASTYLNYFSINPSLNTSYFSAFHLTDSLNDFAYQANGVYNDLCITISPVGRFRAGRNASYIINYENQGTTSVNGTVNFFSDSYLNYVSSSSIPTSITNDSIVWSTGILAPFQTGSITVTVNVDSITLIGTNLYSSVRIDPVIGDANTECNYNSWIVAVTGSFDPNEILVDRTDITTVVLVNNNPYLNYIINFQNTGNDTAFNVRVLNNIPNNLEINSFEFVSSSNPVNINYGAHARLLEFNFNSILLPDSNVNEPASHGFIRYKIKPLQTLNAGDTIGNKAFIYFDFNAPVETNSALTTIVIPTGVEEGVAAEGSKQLFVYPNPATNSCTISLNNTSSPHHPITSSLLTLYDIAGRVLLQQSFNTREKLDVSKLSSGIYLLEVKDKQGNSVNGKLVKE